MKLYYFSGACSLASNIALREAGLNFELVKVDRRTRKTGDGLDYNEVNPKGYVPALRLGNGEVLTENIAVLQYIADQSPAAKLAPPAGTMDRYRLIEWLAFISTEIHKSFSPLFRDDAHAEVKQHARKHITARLGYLNGAMGSRSFVMGEQFTVADAYLFTVLGWGRYVDVQLAQWPHLQRHHERVGARPHVIEALKSEGLLK
ncbi:MAG: glutathione transferase GstA [Gammaproteobacteria bacterium]|nr:glutathione transferase GstA [Gammaproteobacteria bacterium]MBV9723778.1 glutathione transferase GstA [Gammaproteobacteria bacterium]